MNLLHIDASPRGERSHSRKMTREFVETWKQFHPQDRVIYRDIGRHPIPHVTEAWIAAAFAPSEKRSPEMKHALRLSDELVDEFLVADIEGISIHVFFHLPASILFVVGSILFIPTDKNS